MAEHLLSESLESGPDVRSISDEIDVAGRLLATEGAIDLAAQRDRLSEIGFESHNIDAVYESYFDALFDPSYPFDIPAALAAGTGPEDTDLENYLTAAFRLALREPARRAETLALWEENFDRMADSHTPSGSTSFFILEWLARNDPALAALYFQRAAEVQAYVSGPGGWMKFFRMAAFHCRDGRPDEGRRLLVGLQSYLPLQSMPHLYVPALLDCEGEEATFAAIEAVLAKRAIWADLILRDNPEVRGYIVTTLEELSRDLRRGFANWLYHQNRGAEVAAIWTRYGAAEIAKRHLANLDWLPARLEKNQSAPVQSGQQLDAETEAAEARLNMMATVRGRDLTLEYDGDSTERLIELEWPSPGSIAAVRKLLQSSNGTPLETAFVVGLERKLGCATSDITMFALLDDISALENRLDQARAIIELLRFAHAPLAETAPTDYDCLVK
ncbi:hypothetical protein EI545_02265 [Tabrizicola piscis]|uniref:Uncharacterized protein n=1 Tax=Tabrizicola piscis TaxID=2494374 RepID=A0A3S8U2I0_9RHOB|nr:hypothetical protein [Tabrizicola piscis]AZL57768.1 hypothetical protein EI545_02265 [Tabrizicola piscis]